MALMTIRSTYALDPETVHTLERLAKQWSVSKSEALRRAIHAAGGRQQGTARALRALNMLQQSVNLSASQARQWVSETRTARRAASSRRAPRQR